MTMTREPPSAGRGSFLSRVLDYVDSRIHRQQSEDGSAGDQLGNLLPIRAATENFRPNLEPHRPDDDAIDNVQTVENRLYLLAREQIKHQSWGRAQRLLEQVAREYPDGPAPLDLQSIRTLRRSQRRASRWPSDPDAHLELGRAYFDLDLGEDALREFLLVQRLAPFRAEGFILAALEFIYRGDYTRSIAAWTRARALQADLPSLEDLLAELPT